MATVEYRPGGERSRVLGLVTARGGSKRIPGKNTRLAGGKPLLAWTVLAAMGSRGLDRVVLSTDDEAIARVGAEYGAEVPFLRPAVLAGDASPHIDCVLHALDWLRDNEGFEPTAVCLLQPTSPLRTAADINEFLTAAGQSGCEALVSVCEATEHPYFARRRMADGRLEPFVAQDVAYPRKQDLEPAWFVNGALYYNTVRSLRGTRTFYPPDVKGYPMAVENSFQVDTPLELEIVDFLLNRRAAGQSRP